MLLVRGRVGKRKKREAGVLSSKLKRAGKGLLSLVILLEGEFFKKIRRKKKRSWGRMLSIRNSG